jgi:hypothetical protein
MTSAFAFVFLLFHTSIAVCRGLAHDEVSILFLIVLSELVFRCGQVEALKSVIGLSCVVENFSPHFMTN